MGRSVRSDIADADREMRRFIRAQYAELRRLGYPRMATFARDIAKGDIGTPPPTGEDPVMDAVGDYYWSLSVIERRVLADKYAGELSVAQRAHAAGQTRRQNFAMVERLLYALSGWLKGRGH